MALGTDLLVQTTNQRLIGRIISFRTRIDPIGEDVQIDVEKRLVLQHLVDFFQHRIEMGSNGTRAQLNQRLSAAEVYSH